MWRLLSTSCVFVTFAVSNTWTLMEWNILIEKMATATFDTVLWIIIIGTIIVIVMDNRNPV